MPLFGYSFNNKTQDYIGIGAVVFETNYNLYGVTAFANINPVTDITGVLTYSEPGNAVLSKMQSFITQSLCISINKIFKKIKSMVYYLVKHA